MIGVIEGQAIEVPARLVTERAELGYSRDGITLTLTDLIERTASFSCATPATAAKLGFALIDAARWLEALRERGAYGDNDFDTAAEMKEAAAYLQETFEGDSNDDEHEAGLEAKDLLESLASLLTEGEPTS